jgi:hypothetical protein
MTEPRIKEMQKKISDQNKFCNFASDPFLRLVQKGINRLNASDYIEWLSSKIWTFGQTFGWMPALPSMVAVLHFVDEVWNVEIQIVDIKIVDIKIVDIKIVDIKMKPPRNALTIKQE